MSSHAFPFVLCLLACACDPLPKTADDAGTARAAESAVPSTGAVVASSAPASTATDAAPSSAPSVSAAAPPLSETAQFWFDLARVYNPLVPVCQGGWTGDGEITVKNGTITRFVTIDSAGEKPQAVPAVVGKAAPPVPAKLKKELERGTSIAVCTGSARNTGE